MLKFSRNGKSEHLRSWIVPQSNSSFLSKSFVFFWVVANDCGAAIINSLFDRSFLGLCVSVKIERACRVKV